MQRLWKHSDKMDGVILHNNWPLDESLKDHNETFHILPYFNEVRVEIFVSHLYHHSKTTKNILFEAIIYITNYLH